MGMGQIDRQQQYGQQQLVLLRPPARPSSGGLGGALDGLDIDYDSYILLLGLAAAAGAYALYQIILTKGRRRSFTSGQTWWQFSLDRLSDFVWTGKFYIFDLKWWCMFNKTLTFDLMTKTVSNEI